MGEAGAGVQYTIDIFFFISLALAFEVLAANFCQHASYGTSWKIKGKVKSLAIDHFFNRYMQHICYQ